MKRLLFACAVLLPALSAVGCSCNCCRKGIVLRGDWSLELNRVPHLKSNGPTYQGDCDACDFGCAEVVPGGCIDGCTSERLPAGDAGGGRAKTSQRRGGEFYDEYSGSDAGPPPEPPQPTSAVQPRFHPVPTRPVFEPDYGPELLPSVRPASAAEGGWKTKRRA